MAEPNMFLGRAIAQIANERRKAVDNGHDVAHDYENHTPEELFRIASCYMDVASCQLNQVDCELPPLEWPEDSEVPWVNEPTPLLNAVRGAQFAAAGIDLIYLLMANSEYNPPIHVPDPNVPIPPESDNA